MPAGSFAWRRLAEHMDEVRDNFGRATTHIRTDLIDVPGEHDFTPERLRYYKDGTRRFLQYGDDANYSETNTGHLLEPDADQTLTFTSAERAAYPPGLDLTPSVARRIVQAPQAGDVVGGGYGVIDLANFDPDAIEYAAGSDADGYFWYHTAETGLDEVIFTEVKGGTIVDERGPFDLPRAADVLTIMEAELNWYAVGPSGWTMTHTDIEHFPEKPQRNRFIGAVANDDGKGPNNGSQRIQLAIHQAAGNTGLSLEAGSIGLRASGTPNYQFKSKGHSMDLDVTETTPETYQVCGALRSDPTRPTVKLRINDLDIISTPGNETTRTRVLIVAVDPTETDISPGDFAPPVEHNDKNSVLEEVEDNSIMGPFLDDGNADVTGATLSNAGINPGGYQIGRESVTPEGQGSSTVTTVGEQIGNRALYDTDWALILVDAESAGECELDVNTAQNS